MTKVEPNEPTEEKVETNANPVNNEWSDDFSKDELTIPYKREEVEEKPEPKVEEEEEPEEIKEVTDPEPVVTVEDPGDFVPKDYSFDIKVGDKNITVTSVEQAEKIAEDNAEDLDAKSLLKLIKESNKMALAIERDEKEHDEKKTAFNDQKQNVAEQNERIATIVKEFDYLIGKGKLPAIEDKYKNADWSDPEIAKQPGIKEQKELLTYMEKENGIRTKAGLNPMTSILEAYSAWQLDSDKKTQVETDKAAGEARKQAGARVSSTSQNPAASTAPSGIAVGRTNVFRSNQAQWEN